MYIGFLILFISNSFVILLFKTKYTMAASSGKGYLCHQCAKAAGNDPFKKPAAPRKRKTPGEKRNIKNIEEKRLPTLANLCIQVRMPFKVYSTHPNAIIAYYEAYQRR